LNFFFLTIFCCFSLSDFFTFLWLTHFTTCINILGPQSIALPLTPLNQFLVGINFLKRIRILVWNYLLIKLLLLHSFESNNLHPPFSFHSRFFVLFIKYFSSFHYAINLCPIGSLLAFSFCQLIIISILLWLPFIWLWIISVLLKSLL
jgi:hypothetical protein